MAGNRPRRQGKARQLDLDFSPHLTGRAAKPLAAEVTRELRESDLALLSVERGIQPTHIQRITSRHHALARCLAQGMSATEAGLMTGYTASRISVLRGDPAFEELIAHYTKVDGAVLQDLASSMAGLALDATEALRDRLEESPSEVATGELVDIVKLTADRTGHGPASKTTNVNLNVNLGDRLKAARERAAAPAPLPALHAGGPARTPSSPASGSAPMVIDGTFSEVPK